MKFLLRATSACIHRDDGRKRSWRAFAPRQTHFGERCGFADDIASGGAGFPMHPHSDLAISTIMAEVPMHRGINA